jgi:hypothetical protein
MYDVLVGESGWSSESWNVGLCDGAWSGFLGSSEMGGECITSDCMLDRATILLRHHSTHPAHTVLQETMEDVFPAKDRMTDQATEKVLQKTLPLGDNRGILLGL